MSLKRQKISNPPDIIVPNSLVRQLTDTSSESFFRLFSTKSIITALGVLSLVDKKHPEREVEVRPREILRIVLASRLIERALGGGSDKSRDIPASSFSAINEALVELFRTEFSIQTHARTRSGKSQEKISRVHFLDNFSFIYRNARGENINLDLLPDDAKKNVSKDESRAVFKLRDGRRPSGITFRLNTELAAEMVRRGCRTIFYGEVFGLLRRLSHDPATLRAALWVIASRSRQVKNNRTWLYEKLVAGGKHHTAAEREKRIDEVLAKLLAHGVVSTVDEKDYAAKSRKPGKYLVLSKAAKWRVPNGADPEPATPGHCEIRPPDIEKEDMAGRAKDRPAIYQKIYREIQGKAAEKRSNNALIEEQVSLSGVHDLPSGGTRSPFRGYIPQPPIGNSSLSAREEIALNCLFQKEMNLRV